MNQPALTIRVPTEEYQRRLKEKELLQEPPSFEAPPFQVFTQYEISTPLRHGLKKIIGDAVDSVGEDFAYSPQVRVQLILLQGSTYASIDDPEVESAGFYQNKKIRMNFDFREEEAKLLKDFRRVFRHEYTHLVIASMDAGRTPRWLNEGLAVYEEREKSERRRGEGRRFYQAMQKEGTFIPIEEFVKRPLAAQYSENPQYFYTQSYILAKHLVERYGFAKLRLLFKTMKEGSSFSSAFEKIYQITLEELAHSAHQD